MHPAVCRVGVVVVTREVQHAVHDVQHEFRERGAAGNLRYLRRPPFCGLRRAPPCGRQRDIRADHDLAVDAPIPPIAAEIERQDIGRRRVTGVLGVQAGHRGAADDRDGEDSGLEIFRAGRAARRVDDRACVDPDSSNRRPNLNLDGP